MNSDADTSKICIKIILALHELFDNANIDAGHGVDHARKVLEHANNALCVSKEPEDKTFRQAIRYAALLHDADDRKFFPLSKDYENARCILRQVLPGKRNMEKLTIKMIKLVSCSQNGNSTEGLKNSELWMVIPRLCDRLEAMGEIGILRVWTYNKYINRPLFLSTTPRITDEDNLKKIVTPEKFSSYLRNKESESMIDHFYDKLLHIGTDEVFSIINNPYLRSEAKKRHNYMIDFILRFGEDGAINIRELNRIRAREWK